MGAEEGGQNCAKATCGNEGGADKGTEHVRKEREQVEMGAELRRG